MTTQPEPYTADDSAPTSSPKRINVAVTAETVRALQAVIEREGVSLTEALRRLVGYGGFIYQAATVGHAQVLVKQGDATREIVLI